MHVFPRAVALLSALALLDCARSAPVRPLDDPPVPPKAASATAPSQPPAPAPAGGETANDDEPTGPGWLGVDLALRPPELPGVLVRATVPGSPAERAGVAAGDVIVSIEGENVARPAEVVALISGRQAGDRVGLLLHRGQEEKLVAVTLEALPNEEGLMKRRYVDNAAPSLLELKTVQGSTSSSLNELRGQVVVIEFWATWCIPCRITAPMLSSWSDRYGAEGLRVLGVTAEPVALAAEGATRHHLTYAVFSDDTGKTTRSYRAFALPTLFVVDRHGVVRDVMVGFSSERLREIEHLIERLLAER